jgi:hypothetical protein
MIRDLRQKVIQIELRGNDDSIKMNLHWYATNIRTSTDDSQAEPACQSDCIIASPAYTQKDPYSEPKARFANQ